MTSFFRSLASGSAAEVTNASVNWPAPIQSYDVHVYYTWSQYEEAAQLKTKVQGLFPHLPQSRLWDLPIGPHPTPMFEVDVHQAVDFATFVPWMAVHHGNLSVLVHPNTGDFVKDHTENAMWIGERLELDVDMLKRAQAALDADKKKY